MALHWGSPGCLSLFRCQSCHPPALLLMLLPSLLLLLLLQLLLLPPLLLLLLLPQLPLAEQLLKLITHFATKAGLLACGAGLLRQRCTHAHARRHTQTRLQGVSHACALAWRLQVACRGSHRLLREATPLGPG